MKINIIQFLPFFPPHKGGLETVAEEIGIYWTKENFGRCINVTSHFNQKEELKKNEKIVFSGEVIGYKKNGVEILVVPSFVIINDFPVYKIWSKKYKIIKKYLKKEFQNNKESMRIITHTRFFLTTLIAGKFAKKENLKWIHIEHGSDYVKLSSKIKTKLAYFYDKIIGKKIFRKADKILAISEACKKFINGKFTKREVNVFYRGLEIDFIKNEKKGEIKIVFVGRLVNLKGVDLLIQAYKTLNLERELVIIGDGEERKNLENVSKGENIKFLGFKNRDFIIDFLSRNNCILVNPSYQEGLPTTVIEGLLKENIVVASDVGGTKEISNKNDLLLFEKGKIEDLKEKINYAMENYNLLKGKSIKSVEEKFSSKKSILKFYNFVK